MLAAMVAPFWAVAGEPLAETSLSPSNPSPSKLSSSEPPHADRSAYRPTLTDPLFHASRCSATT
jgi:hypothetical protein